MIRCVAEIEHVIPLVFQTALKMVLKRLSMLVSFAALVAGLATLAHAEPNLAPAGKARSSATPAQITQWMGELNDDRYLVRERATRQLLDAGPAALDHLFAAAESDRPEPADSAIWILQRLANATDAGVRRQALERLVHLKKRPRVVAAARDDLIQIYHEEAVAAIEKLGGRYVEGEYYWQMGTLARFGRVVIDDEWRGGDAGLRHLRRLIGLQQVDIVGTDISFEGLKQLQHCKSLQSVHLFGTNLKPEQLPELRKLMPQVAQIDYRRGALLGVGTSAADSEGPAIVWQVTPGSAADVAGIQANDIIQKFEGSPVANFKSLTQKIGEHGPGDEVTIEALRNGQPKTFKVKLGRWKTIE
jgi:hypothetical protein